MSRRTSPWRAAFDSALARFGGPLDILVNNAGVGAGDDEHGWRTTFEVNLHGTVRCCEAALASMRPRGYGKIVNISSISGHDARGSAGSYGTSKAAVLRYTKGLAFDEAPNGLNINAVCPGAVWTDMQQRSFARPEEVDAAPRRASRPYDAFVEYYRPLTPLARVQSPDDVGRAVAFLASDDAAADHGAVPARRRRRDPVRRMRITDVTVECYSAPLPTPISNGRYTYATSERCLVRIETTRASPASAWATAASGLAGAPQMIEATVESLRPWLVGEDPLAVERLWRGCGCRSCSAGVASRRA